MPTVVQRNTSFEEIKESVRADEKGRVILGRDFSGKNFRVSKSADGEILLTPLATIPERDLWLYQDPQALAIFRNGLAAAAEGRVGPPIDFTRYADDGEDA